MTKQCDRRNASKMDCLTLVKRDFNFHSRHLNVIIQFLFFFLIISFFHLLHLILWLIIYFSGPKIKDFLKLYSDCLGFAKIAKI